MLFGGTLNKIGDKFYPSGHVGQSANWQRAASWQKNNGCVAIQRPDGSAFFPCWFRRGNVAEYEAACDDAAEKMSTLDQNIPYLVVCIS